MSNINILIPAKSTSRRIQRKNLQIISRGMSLLEWTILNWDRILPDVQIWVATDDGETREIAAELDCKHYDLRLADVNDDRSATDLLVEFHQTMNQNGSGVTILAQCTSPFTFRRDVITALGETGPVIRSSYQDRFHVPETQNLLSQNLPRQTVITGNFFIVRGDISDVKDWAKPEMMSPVNYISRLDINIEQDLEIARWLAKRIGLEDLAEL